MEGKQLLAVKNQSRLLQVWLTHFFKSRGVINEAESVLAAGWGAEGIRGVLIVQQGDDIFPRLTRIISETLRRYFLKNPLSLGHSFTTQSSLLVKVCTFLL